MNILLTIREYKKFTETEKHIRDYILKNKENVTSMSIYELADKAFVSPSSITRFCHKIGIDSFKSFRIGLVKEINVFNHHDVQSFSNMSIQPEDTPETVIDKITKVTLQSIQETKMLINEKDLIEVAKLLCRSSSIELYGVGEADIVALDAAIKFNRIGKKTQYNSAYTMQRITALNSDENSVAIVISYTGETPEIMQLVEYLKKNDATIIAITGNTKNTLSEIADYNLFISSIESTYRTGALASRTSMLYVMDLLYNVCISMEYDRFMNKISLTRVPQKGDKV